MIEKFNLTNLDALKVRLIFKVHTWFTNVGKLNIVKQVCYPKLYCCLIYSFVESTCLCIKLQILLNQ
jgi:hypothetical protein